MKRLLLLAALLGGTANAATIAITGGTVATAGPAGTIENGTVIVRDGKVAAVGRGLAIPPGATVVDATGKYVTPGPHHRPVDARHRRGRGRAPDQ